MSPTDPRPLSDYPYNRHYADNWAELGPHVACCNARWMMTDDTEVPDRLVEAGRILRGETRLLATEEHLKAVAELVARAAELRRRGLTTRYEQWTDWLRDAAKLEPPV